MSDTTTVTKSAIKPHEAFKVTTPDTVAECWDGVYHAINPDGTEMRLYEALWNCTAHYNDKHLEHIEDIGPHDVIGINSTASFWHLFTPAQQAKLNELAKLNDAQLRLDSNDEDY
jgi:hypothetical protein